MKNLVKYTHKLLVERRLLKKDIKTYLRELHKARDKIEDLEKVLEESEDSDRWNTKELNRIKFQMLDSKNQIKIESSEHKEDLIQRLHNTENSYPVNVILKTKDMDEFLSKQI